MKRHVRRCGDALVAMMERRRWVFTGWPEQLEAKRASKAALQLTVTRAVPRGAHAGAGRDLVFRIRPPYRALLALHTPEASGCTGATAASAAARDTHTG